MRVVRHSLAISSMMLGVPGCREAPRNEAAPPPGSAVVDTARIAEATVAEKLPPLGIAIPDSLDRWCAALAADSLAVGTRVTLVFPDSGSAVLDRRGRVVVRRATPCATAFPQLGLAEDATYELIVDDTAGLGAAWSVAMVAASEAPWSRGTDGVARADLDGDGTPEEARKCREGEGEHFTLWSRPAGAASRRVWKRYFDWGAFVDADCAPGEADDALPVAAPPDGSSVGTEPGPA